MKACKVLFPFLLLLIVISCEDLGIEDPRIQVGDVYEGGVVFNVYNDSEGNVHGLIVAMHPIGHGIIWSNIDDEVGPFSVSSFWNGQANCEAITTQTGHTTSAALQCFNFESGGFDDWYLPAIDELHLLYDNRIVMEKVLFETGNSLLGQNNYWSSTEYGPGLAWEFQFYSTIQSRVSAKSNTAWVRAVRAF
jgi:hypothetical protein